uniref:Uncharacterized protein n=1 Tax=Prolemur simus TaxID=1328070 RepID=A0A8C9AR60_PROSS
MGVLILAAYSGWNIVNVNFHVLLSFSEIQEECALQLRRIGDKLHFQQKLLNLIAKLLRSGT